MLTSLMKYFSVMFFLLVCPITSWSAIGNRDTTIESDRAQMDGSMTHENHSTHGVYSIVTPRGLVVREFVSPSGTVFGIAWEGPHIPDLRQLLGAYYQDYAAAVKAERMKHRGRRPLNITCNGLVIQMSGHMRALIGRVYLPSLVPGGVAAETIR